MKHPFENQSQEVLAGLVERVTYHNVKNGFCVLRAKARGHRDVVTVVGRTATVILGQGARRVIGVGRVKTPTLAIVCKRELEIRNFVLLAYFEIVVTAKVAGGQFQMRHAPQDRIARREIAQDVVNAARGFEGALAVRVEDKRQGPPKLHDLPSLAETMRLAIRLAGQQDT